MKKLRPFYPADQLQAMYGGVYDPNRWPEHTLRLQRTGEIVQELVNRHDLRSIADFSCGDGSIVHGLKMFHDASFLMTDVGKGDPPIEDQVLTMPFTDLFICTETIEHLEAPWTVLEYAAMRARYVVLSTPLDEDPAIGNYEHYWSFTQWDVATLLHQSGFSEDQKFESLTRAGWTYEYQIWTARSKYFGA